MRTLWLLIAALLVFASAVQAQIAAPRLNPVTLEAGAPFNPAVLPWSGPSRIGAGLVDVTVEESLVGPPATTAELATGDGAMVQGRWVGENFAIAVEAFKLELENVTGGTLDSEASLIGVGVQFGEFISVGIGQQTDEQTDLTDTFESTLPLVGATVRLAEVIYIGAAVGEVTQETSQAGDAFEADATVARFGVAYHWRDGPNGVHLEAYREEPDTLVFEGRAGTILPAGATNEFEVETDGFTVEVVFANVLIAFESLTTETTQVIKFLGVPFSTDREEEKEITLSVGWAPLEGLNLVATVDETELTDENTGDVETIDAVFLGAAWLF